MKIWNMGTPPKKTLEEKRTEKKGDDETHILGGHVGVDALAVEQKTHGVRAERLARAERVEDLRALEGTEGRYGGRR